MARDWEINVPTGQYVYESKSGLVFVDEIALPSNTYRKILGLHEAVKHYVSKNKVM